MRIGLLRHDPTIGDLHGAASAISGAAQQAWADGLDVLVLPELAVCGYPPRDLLLRDGFAAACRDTVGVLAADVPADRLLLLGAPWLGETGLFNALIACTDGAVTAIAAKRLLPAYDVFDEDRYFTPGERACVVPFAGRRLGLLVCEDCWQGGDVDAGPYMVDPIADTIDAGADVLVVVSSSPFIVGKHERQRARLCEVAAGHSVDVVAVNQAGAHDDLVFDGDAIAVDTAGRLRALRAPFEATSRIDVDLEAFGRLDDPPRADIDEQRVLALREAIAGYVHKTNAPGVLLGLSGGIDSAVVASLAVSAIGPDAVDAITMPGRYTSSETRADADAIAQALGVRLESLGIEPVHAALRTVLGDSVQEGDLVDQNLQARARGMLLMGRSNARGSLVLACGNKSELAVGYATLYGDMNGAMCPIGDVLKTDVYAMARWINEHFAQVGLPQPPIPASVIERPPSAELRPDQCDQDSLPSYDTLDAIIRALVEVELDDAAAAAAAGVDLAMVQKWRTVIDQAQFKRKQAPIIPKLTRRAFGRGRPWPLVQRQTGAPTPEQAI